jgi:hypothetical protein
MKKTMLVMALAIVFVFALSATAFAVGPFLTNDAMNTPDFPGYVQWAWAEANAGETGSPHGNYSTTTQKCQVCHSVHRADPAGVVLTAIDTAPLTSYTESCSFCHGTGATFSTKIVNTAADGTLSPHGNCNRCHIASPHGAGASIYPVLKASLINKNADGAITYDTANSINGLVPADGAAGGMFYDEASLQAKTLGTGYLCASCHSSVPNPDGTTGHLAFAVNEPGGEPSYTYSGAFSTGHQTGHRVWATASTTWNQDGGMGAYYTGGGAAGATSQVAFNPVGGSTLGCVSCHDAKVGSTFVFPHGYANSDETAYAPKSELGSSLIWLTTASNASGSDRAVLGADVAVDNVQLSKDGLCIKCHVSTDDLAGVGITY